MQDAAADKDSFWWKDDGIRCIIHRQLYCLCVYRCTQTAESSCRLVQRVLSREALAESYALRCSRRQGAIVMSG